MNPLTASQMLTEDVPSLSLDKETQKQVMQKEFRVCEEELFVSLMQRLMQEVQETIPSEKEELHSDEESEKEEGDEN